MHSQNPMPSAYSWPQAKWKRTADSTPDKPGACVRVLLGVWGLSVWVVPNTYWSEGCM